MEAPGYEEDRCHFCGGKEAGFQMRELGTNNMIWVVSWNGHNTAIVERVTSTQVIVVVDYSFQGGSERSVQKYPTHGVALPWTAPVECAA
jgi:hypothetical protein